jgi:hypothetical protein
MPLQILLFAPSSSREMRVPFAENRRSSSMPPFNANHTTHVHSIYFSRRLANVSILFATSSRHGDVPGRGRRFGHRDRSPLLDVPGRSPLLDVPLPILVRRRPRRRHTRRRRRRRPSALPRGTAPLLAVAPTDAPPSLLFAATVGLVVALIV